MMYWFYVDLTKVLLFYNVISSARSSTESTESTEEARRSIGGRDATADEYPYAVRLETKDADTYKHVCSAFVVSSTVTFTAAHCCLYIRNRKVVIRYGTATGDPKDAKFSEVLSYHRPPAARSYNHPVIRDDLAVLKTQPIELKKYARISALDHRVLLGQKVSILSYGMTKRGTSFNDTLTLNLPLQVLDAMWAKCDEGIGNLYPLVCAVKPCGKETSLCPGDSGAAVVHGSGVVGITTRGLKPLWCQVKNDSIQHNYMDYMEPLSSYIDWITYKVKELGPLPEEL